MTIDQLAITVGETLKKQQLVLTTAESCTGGGLSYWITSVAGSSAWFDRGFVTYSNASKMAMLNVKSETLNQHGAVSEQTAIEMAEGALKNSAADISISITGIAGPDGGSAEKPVGTVWIGMASNVFQTFAFVNVFKGDRQSIRDQVIVTALQKLLDCLS